VRPSNTFCMLCMSSVFALTTDASACNCRRGDDEKQKIILQEMFQEPGAVLAEVVVGDTDIPSPHRGRTKFKVINHWAGARGKTLIVEHNARAGGCGLDFHKGYRIMLLATRVDGVLMTNQCAQRIAGYTKRWGRPAVQTLVGGGK
jgi:hypothetical protein